MVAIHNTSATSHDDHVWEDDCQKLVNSSTKGAVDIAVNGEKAVGKNLPTTSAIRREEKLSKKKKYYDI